jgi:hypothetical protein
MGQVWVWRLNKTTGVVGYFEDFVIESQPKMAHC